MKKIFFLAVAALALTSCDKNDDNSISSDMPVKITATIGRDYVTRAKDDKWSVGDKIGITATSGPAVRHFVNMEYTKADGDGFTGNPIYFYNPMTLSAYYPFDGKEGTAPGKEGTIESDTRTENQTAGNQPRIDFLYAGETGIDIEDDKLVINFLFEHKMSKITFIFKNGKGADVSKITSYTIDGLVLEGTFNTVKGVCAVKEGGKAESLSIDLQNVEVQSVETETALSRITSHIVFPQKVNELSMKIRDSENQDYACDLNFGDQGLEPGNNYQFTITVNKTGLTVNQSTITDWETKPIDTGAESDWKNNNTDSGQ